MHILITGGSGMVGKNILQSPIFSDFKITAPTSQELNLLDAQKVDEFVSDLMPDFIIHAAGRVGGIQANIAKPVSFLVDNLQMGQNIVLAASKAGVKNFINLASSCMYPKNGLNPLKEDTILTGALEPTNEGYAIAKITITRLCEYISKTTDLNYKTIIPCNLYGPHDKFSPQNSHMIPAVIRKIHHAKRNNLDTVEIWGDGNAMREFMYVEDLIDFISYAIYNFDKMPQNINVGLGKDYTINEYYETIKKIIGFEGVFKHDLTKPVGMLKKVIDNTKLNQFGWQPKTDLEQGIRKTYQFFKDNNLSND